MRTRLLVAAAILFAAAGCGGPPAITGSTPQEALQAFTQKQVTVYQEVALGENRILMHLQPGHPAPTAVLTVKDKWGRWQVEGGWASGPLRDIGPVSFGQHWLGHVEEKVGETTFGFPRCHAIYGTTNDPRITWVEVTLTAEEGMVMRAPVVNGTWVAWFPIRSGNAHPRFAIRGGAGDTELFNIADGHKAAK